MTLRFDVMSLPSRSTANNKSNHSTYTCVSDCNFSSRMSPLCLELLAVDQLFFLPKRKGWVVKLLMVMCRQWVDEILMRTNEWIKSSLGQSISRSFIHNRLYLSEMRRHSWEGTVHTYVHTTFPFSHGFIDKPLLIAPLLAFWVTHPPNVKAWGAFYWQRALQSEVFRRACTPFKEQKKKIEISFTSPLPDSLNARLHECQP